MKLLMIDTSGIVASAAILDEQKLIGEVIINYKKKHSEKLLPAIDHLFDDTGITIQDMDAFGVVKGPGSFTGLRIGLATAKGFAQALKKPVIGVSTLEALAANLFYTEGLICPLIDARRGQVFTAVYRCQSGQCETVIPEQMMLVDELFRRLSDFDQSVYLLGEAIGDYGERICSGISHAQIVPQYLRMNRASSAAQIAFKKLLAGEGEHYTTIEPFYMRPSYAEEG